MSDKWTHPMCDACWNFRHPDRRPVRVVGSWGDIEQCCFCRETTKSGIYVRQDPTMTPCRGMHEEELKQ